MAVDEVSARRMLDKLGTFAAGLDSDERVALAALLAPGIELALRVDAPSDPGVDVEGFGPNRLVEPSLAEAVAAAVRAHGAWVVLLGEQAGDESP